MSKFLIACGGTGGHLSPGIALAEALIARGHEATLFISRKRVDTRLCEKYPHLTATRVPGAPFAARPDRLLRFVVKQSHGFFFSWRFLRQQQPDAIIGFGGFTNAGVVFAGRLLGIPVALHEANRIPGRAVRALADFAHRLYLPPGVRLPGTRGVTVRHTGLPVRNEIARVPCAEARTRLGLNPTQKLLVVIGGSQGSGRLNQWVEEHVAAFTHEGIQLWCVAGLGNCVEGERLYQSKNGATVHVRFEAFSDRMGDLLSAADLVVSRAGAGSIAELIRCETPAILIPYPFAADNHQWANARYFEQQGGGFVLDEQALPQLRAEVLDVIFNDWLLHKFSENLHRMSRENSIDTIVHDLEELALRIPPKRHLRHAPAPTNG